MMLLSSKNFHNNEELTKMMKIEQSGDGKSIIDKMHEVGASQRNKSLDGGQIVELNLSADLYYKNIENDLWTIEEFWIVTSRTLMVDFRLPLNFLAKIIQFGILIFFNWLLYKNLYGDADFNN